MKDLSPGFGSVAAICRLIGLSQSSYYHQPGSRFDDNDDLRLLQMLIRLAGKHPTWGYRNFTREVRKTQRWQTVNAKRVRRLLKTAGIAGTKPRQALLTTHSRHGFQRFPNMVRDWSQVVRPNQVWAADITYIVLSTGEVIYLAVVLDVFTRVVRGWELGLDLSHRLALNALKRAFKQGVCEIHHSDQGIQYATPAYVQALQQRGCQVSMTDKGAAWQNGYVERWMRTLKEEEVYLSDYASIDDALRNIGKFIETVYNKKRAHSALGYLTPVQFEAKWRSEHTPKSPP